VWELQVPDDKILGIVDSFIWNRILDPKKKAIPRWLEMKWCRECSDVDDGNAYIEAKIEEYHSQPPPNGDWWSVLFIPAGRPYRSEDADALLKHPIAEEWVVSVGGNT
jgi:hypothetical protein